MRFCVLGSGSKGNATFIEGGGTRILIDAGFSGIEIERRLASIEVDIDTVTAILVTHEHSDHIRGVQVLARRFELPVYISPKAKEAAGSTLDRLVGWQAVEPGKNFSIEGLDIHPFSVSHDTAEPLGFKVSYAGRSVGYCTDTGAISHLMRHHLAGCSGLVLECNHDLEMLKNGGYPPYLQQRIRSKAGHLTNSDAAAFLVELIHAGLEHVVLAHISETNNTPDLARETVEEHLRLYELTADEQRCFTVSVARQDLVGAVVCLNGRRTG